MSSPADIEKKSKKIIILGEGTTQELDDTTLTAQSKYGNFVYITKKRFALSLHYNGSNIFVLGNAGKTYQFKAKDLEIQDYVLC